MAEILRILLFPAHLELFSMTRPIPGRNGMTNFGTRFRMRTAIFARLQGAQCRITSSAATMTRAMTTRS
jgi:hypothetical protein